MVYIFTIGKNVCSVSYTILIGVRNVCVAANGATFFVRGFGYALFIYWRKAMKFIKFFIIVVSLISFLFIFSACIKTTDTDIIKKNEIDTTITPFNCIHNYQDHVCSICNAMLGSDGLEYTLNEDKRSYCVSGIGTCNETKIYIASVYNKMPVTLIKEKAFLNCDNIERVIIPDSITKISASSFQNCEKLVEVSIPDSINTIDERAFYRCIKLCSITIPHGVKYIEESTFYYCSSLTNITIPNFNINN